MQLALVHELLSRYYSYKNNHNFVSCSWFSAILAFFRELVDVILCNELAQKVKNSQISDRNVCLASGFHLNKIINYDNFS